MKIYLIFIIAVIAVFGREIDVRDIENRIAFEEFKIKNNKTYNSTHEEHMAYIHFRESLIYINDCNSEYFEGNATFKCSVNNFADKDDEYFADRSNDMLLDEFWMRGDDDHPEVTECTLQFLNYSAMGYPSLIRNQGRCGACWAFAATGVCESALYKKTNKLWKFSEQQLVDCTQGDDFNNFGCRGGRISVGMQYFQIHGPINESDYGTYNQLDNNTCRYDSSKVITKIDSFTRLIKVEENYLKNLLCEYGPVSVAVDGTSKGFQFYSSGIFNDPQCKNYINHAMLLVGFGTDPEFGPYWILKNSYGKKWGEYGYMRLARGMGNLCGILEQVFICNV